MCALNSTFHLRTKHVYAVNDLTQYQRPDHYVRYIGVCKVIQRLQVSLIPTIEPLDLDLSRQVEYDMDEQGRRALYHLDAWADAQQTKNGYSQ